MLSALKKSIKSGLAHHGIRIQLGHDWSKVEEFIPFRETLAAAQAEGMQVGDWIDARMNGIPGASQGTIERMAAAGVFAGARAIAEIGPGSGRYLYRAIELAKPERYEVYETAEEWATWLAETYPITVQPTDGATMAATPDASVDLAHAHKVFSTIPFIASIRYWREMVRTTKPGGYIVFDCMTEQCLSPELIGVWAERALTISSYPAAMPAATAAAETASAGLDSASLSIAVTRPTATTIRVTVTYDAQLMTTLIADLLGGINTITLEAAATMNVE